MYPSKRLEFLDVITYLTVRMTPYGYIEGDMSFSPRDKDYDSSEVLNYISLYPEVL